MYNGYEIWKSDAEKCARYRITNQGGAMCGRCMKTCPWNLEGLFSEAAFRWVAMRFPGAARWIAWLGRSPRSRRHQSGQEMVVGHRSRSRHRPAQAREGDPCPRAQPRTRPQIRGSDARGLPRRRDAAALPGALPGQPRGGHRTLSCDAVAGRTQGADRARRNRWPRAAIQDAGRTAAGLSGDPEATRGHGRGYRAFRIRCSQWRRICRNSTPARMSTS